MAEIVRARKRKRQTYSSGAVLRSNDLVLVDLLGGGVCVRSRRLQLGVHVGNPPLDELIVGDWRVELTAGMAVRQGHVERGLHEPQRTAAHDETLEVKPDH